MPSPFVPSVEPREQFQPTDPFSNARPTEGTAFEQARAAITHAQNEFHHYVNNVLAPERHKCVPGDWERQVDKFASTGSYTAIERHVQAVQQLRDKAQDNLDEVRRSLTQDDGDTATELRANRFWNRTRAILDNANPASVITVGRDQMAKATPAELNILLQELPSYCAARGVKTTDWIDTTAAEVSPEYGRAAKKLAKANEAVRIVEGGAQSFQRAVAGRQTMRIPLTTNITKGSNFDRYDPEK